MGEKKKGSDLNMRFGIKPITGAVADATMEVFGYEVDACDT